VDVSPLYHYEQGLVQVKMIERDDDYDLRPVGVIGVLCRDQRCFCCHIRFSAANGGQERIQILITYITTAGPDGDGLGFR
jgi:hypothetical protein